MAATVIESEAKMRMRFLVETISDGILCLSRGVLQSPPCGFHNARSAGSEMHDVQRPFHAVILSIPARALPHF
jgi:predicted secreted protein